jgi:hypothetical protein
VPTWTRATCSSASTGSATAGSRRGRPCPGSRTSTCLSGSKPRLVYVKRAETREERLRELIRRIELDDRTSYRPFSDADELEDLIENDLALMLTERFAAAAPRAGEPAAPDEAPPPWATPLERGELFGRAALLDEVTALLGRADVGLVTLTGPGGTGKTRLAVHVAHALNDVLPDGVLYVPLAACAPGARRGAGDRGHARNRVHELRRRSGEGPDRLPPQPARAHRARQLRAGHRGRPALSHACSRPART